jgi:hypothetical protein
MNQFCSRLFASFAPVSYLCACLICACVVACVVVCVTPPAQTAWAQASSTSTGSLYAFLRAEPTARAAALGGTMVAVPNDVGALFTNPALIGTLDSGALCGTFFKHAIDINAGTVCFASDLGAFGVSGAQSKAVVGVSANYVNYGRFERTDRNGVVLGSFAAADVALGISYSNELDSNWHYGITLKYINNRLDNLGAGAFAADLGMAYSIPKARTTLGVAVLHLGAQVVSVGGATVGGAGSSNLTREPLPLDVRLGVSHQLRGLPLMVTASLNRLADPANTITDRLLNFSIGGELSLGKVIQVRIGYENQRRRELAPDAQPRLSGLSAGVGVILPILRVDYSLSSYGTIGLLHRFSVMLPM